MIDPMAVLGPGATFLVFSAVVNTMPEQPPESLWKIGSWLYKWVHDCLKTIVSSRGPAKPV